MTLLKDKIIQYILDVSEDIFAVFGLDIYKARLL